MQLAKLTRQAQCEAALRQYFQPISPGLEMLRAAAKSEAAKARSQLRAENQAFFRKLDNRNL